MNADSGTLLQSSFASATDVFSRPTPENVIVVSTPATRNDGFTSDSDFTVKKLLSTDQLPSVSSRRRYSVLSGKR